MKNQEVLRPASWKHDRDLFITQAGIIAALYVVLTLVFAPFAFKEVQIRISEMLTILPFFFPAAIPGLFLGCIVGNILGGAVLPDVVFGSLATLIGAFGTYYVGRLFRAKDEATLVNYLIFGAFCPVVANALIVPFILKYAYGVPMPIPLMMFTVGVGEIASCAIFGVMLGRIVYKITA